MIDIEKVKRQVSERERAREGECKGEGERK